MAKKNQVNKSQAIRTVLEKDPKMTVHDVVSTLAQQGTRVQPSLVYVVKNKAKIKRRRQAREKAQGVVTSGDPVTTIKKVKALAGEVGGMRKLKELVGLLTE